MNEQVRRDTHCNNTSIFSTEARLGVGGVDVFLISCWSSFAKDDDWYKRNRQKYDCTAECLSWWLNLCKHCFCLSRHCSCMCHRYIQWPSSPTCWIPDYWLSWSCRHQICMSGLLTVKILWFRSQVLHADLHRSKILLEMINFWCQSFSDCWWYVCITFTYAQLNAMDQMYSCVSRWI